MLLVLNAYPGPPITFNWEQGHLNLSGSPANREQVIFLPPTCLYHCWCIIDTAYYRCAVPPEQRISPTYVTKLPGVCASLGIGTRKCVKCTSVSHGWLGSSCPSLREGEVFVLFSWQGSMLMRMV